MNFLNKSNVSHLELKKYSTSNNFFFFFGAWDVVRYKLHLPSWYMTNIQDGLFMFTI